MWQCQEVGTLVGTFYPHQGHDYLSNAERIQMQVCMRPKKQPIGPKSAGEKGKGDGAVRREEA